MFEADALALVPLFTDHTGEMNFLNKTSGAMSLTSDVAGIANSIGQGGSLAGFLKDLGHTCCSSPGALRHAIRVGFVACYCHDPILVVVVVVFFWCWCCNGPQTEENQGSTRVRPGQLATSVAAENSHRVNQLPRWLLKIYTGQTSHRGGC